MNIELAKYGLVVDSEWCYIALSWEILIISTILTAATYAYKLWRDK